MTSARHIQQAPALQIPPAAAHASPSRAPAVAGPLRPLEPYDAADHVTRLFRLAIRLCGSRDLAEDLVQETYARVLARPRFVRGNGFSYLARALRNVFSNHLRSEARRNEAPAAPERLDLPDPRPTADPETAALTGEVYAAIAELPDKQRAVLAAVDLAGMSYAETAALLDVAVGTVMSRLYRARDRIALALPS
jgi:RNA polymerase sigma-70 factor (ECF subfamily)